MLSENGDVIKIDSTRRQTTRPWVSKMADRCYHVASISRQFRRPIYWNAHASSSFDHAHWGYNSVFKQIRRCSVNGRKRYQNYKCGRKSFWKRSKTVPFSFENGLVWTGPYFINLISIGWYILGLKTQPFQCGESILPQNNRKCYSSYLDHYLNKQHVLNWHRVLEKMFRIDKSAKVVISWLLGSCSDIGLQY